MENRKQKTLRNPMHIGVGEVCRYEDVSLRFEGEMVVEGTLRLKGCSMDVADTRIIVKGTLHMEGCEVEQPNSAFLEIRPDADAVIENCVFHCSVPFWDSVIIARDNRDFELRNCRFYGTPAVISMTSKRNGRSSRPYAVPFVDASKGKIIGCEFYNFTGCRVANVLSVVGTTFENCHRIEVGGSGETTRVSRCRFMNCKEVNVYDGTIECCEFRGLETAFFNLSSVVGCTFSALKCDFDHIIALDDSNMENCIFEDVELTEDSYLIDTTPESSVAHCNFRNCRTSRTDLELIHSEWTEGFLFKKTVEYDVVDHDTCTGLDEVEKVLLRALVV